MDEQLTIDDIWQLAADARQKFVAASRKSFADGNAQAHLDAEAEWERRQLEIYQLAVDAGLIKDGEIMPRSSKPLPPG